MSVVRWGCVSCALHPGLTGEVIGFPENDNAAILNHLDEHRAAGHMVPEWVMDGFRTAAFGVVIEKADE